MDKLKAIEVHNASENKTIKVYVSIPVAEKCQTDKAFAEELYKQLQDQNIEDGSVLEIEIEAVQCEEPPIENTAIKREIEDNDLDDELPKFTKRQKLSDPDERDTWTRNQTAKLLKAYQLCAKRKTYNSDKEFWSAIARELLKQGINKRYTRCSNQFVSLVTSYKTAKNKKNSSKTFEFYQDMNQIMNDASSKNMPWIKSLLDDDNEESDAQSEDGNEEEKKYTHWPDDEILKLINICKKNKSGIHKKNNQEIWKVVSKELSKLGVIKDPEDCRDKWDNLKLTYAKCLANDEKFIYSDDMQSTLFENGHKHNTDDEEDDTNDDDDEDDEAEDDIFQEIEKMKKEYMRKQMTYDVNKQTVPADHTYSWKYNDIIVLIEAYRQQKDKFERRTEAPKEVWEQISAELKKNNIIKSADSCEKKWKSLYSIYSMLKELNFKSDKFIYFNAINSLFGVKQEDVDVTVLAHENRCKCSEKRQADKHQRHLERMEMLGRKLDLEERKIKSFEEYMTYLKGKLVNGKK